MRRIQLQRGPLLCWDIYAMHLVKQAENFSKQLELEELLSYSDKFDWCIDIEDLIKNTTYEALVLTDEKQEICWVNKGFTKMTGYPAKYARGKRPNFLQGAATSQETLQNIRTGLKSGKQVSETIINYRKNGAPYDCAIQIFPIRNHKAVVTHLLALERMV